MEREIAAWREARETGVPYPPVGARLFAAPTLGSAACSAADFHLLVRRDEDDVLTAEDFVAADVYLSFEDLPVHEGLVRARSIAGPVWAGETPLEVEILASATRSPSGQVLAAVGMAPEAEQTIWWALLPEDGPVAFGHCCFRAVPDVAPDTRALVEAWIGALLLGRARDVIRLGDAMRAADPGAHAILCEVLDGEPPAWLEREVLTWACAGLDRAIPPPAGLGDLLLRLSRVDRLQGEGIDALLRCEILTGRKPGVAPEPGPTSLLPGLRLPIHSPTCPVSRDRGGRVVGVGVTDVRNPSPGGVAAQLRRRFPMSPIGR